MECGTLNEQDVVDLDVQNRPLTVCSFGLTDRGCVRSSNEDQFLIAELVKSLRIQQSSIGGPGFRDGKDHGHLFLVSDGVGGSRAGERASSLAVAAVESFLLNAMPWFYRLEGPLENIVTEAFEEAVRWADRHVCDAAYRDPHFTGMGTTLTMAYFFDPFLLLNHAGDSRCYLLRGQNLKRLTQDHTLAAEMVRHGCLSPEEACTHPWRHVVTNVVGGDKPGVKVETQKLQVKTGDRLLLCTDGLPNMVSEDMIGRILRELDDPEKSCELLVAKAKEAGGKDNITAVVAHFGQTNPAADTKVD